MALSVPIDAPVVKTAFDTVALVAANVPVDTLVVARSVPVVNPVPSVKFVAVTLVANNPPNVELVA